MRANSRATCPSVVAGLSLLALAGSCSKENNVVANTINNYSQEIHCEGAETDNPECLAAADAPKGAVCVYGYCRAHCSTDADCEAIIPGSVCLPGTNASGCRMPSEGDCSANGCGTGLSCATDGTCRVDCSADDNLCSLAGLACEDGVCAGVASGYPDSGADAPSDGACTGDCLREWAAWPMPNPVDAGLPNPASYVVGADSVTDNVTGLVWQKAAPSQQYTWADAKVYCADLSLGGSSDWRLPTAIELASLVDFTKRDPAIDEAAFPGTPTSTGFWSSSPVAGRDDSGWFVGFDTGRVSYESKSYTHFVRCVR